MTAKLQSIDIDHLLVFLGETAALSFLQFLRQLLRQHMGPSSFTESSSNVMLEAQSPEANAAELIDDIDLQRNFIQYYLAATSGLLALHTHASVDTLVGRVSAFDSRSRLDQAEALLAVAIGAQAEMPPASTQGSPTIRSRVRG